jgi:L-fuculose-phosphate aldolase
MFESPSLQKAVSHYAQLLHQAGFVANHDGNVSVRLPGEKRFVATPTAYSKRSVEAHDLVTVDIEGKILAGRRKIFSEWHLHAACYKARPDVKAVIHAHPVVSTAFGLAGRALGALAMPEAVVSLGKDVPLIAYAMPKSSSQDHEIAQALKRGSDAVMISANGVLTVGSDLEQAYLRMELVEHYAKILMHTLALSGPVTLPAADVEQLLIARRKAGLGLPTAS